jgi:hypothetical protein
MTLSVGRRYNRFTALELVLSCVVLGLVMAAFIQGARLLAKMELRFTQEHRAVLLLENVVAQLPADCTLDELTELLALEYGRTPMPQKQRVRYGWTRADGVVTLAISTDAGATLAAVQLPFTAAAAGGGP